MPDSLNRRELLRRAAVAGAGLAGAGLSGMAGHAAENAPRPNFVFVFTDDQRWDAMSCMGHPFLRTPNMDRLAAEGACFENAFVVDSLCSPSRATFLTGTYPHIHGVVGNENNDYDHRLPTYATLLQQAGYETGYVGKWHQDSTHANPRPGFGYWLSFRGQGVYNDPELNENGRVFKAQGYMTDLLTDYAVRWLKQPKKAPFCLTVAHKAAHDPRTPAERHKDAFADAQFPKPESFDDDLHDKPAFFRRGAGGAGGAIPDRLPPGRWNGGDQKRLDHYRTLLSVDEGLGSILKALEETGQLDNTVVVFGSDNGYFFGEHRRGDKRLMYEEALRIPLLVRYPRLVRAGSRPQGMALNLDVAQTFLDLAGVPAADTMQGRSLRPLLAGQEGGWRREFLYEYFMEPRYANIPTVIGVRTPRWSYMHYPDLNDIDELYDIQADPRQMRNLALDPAHAATVAQLRKEMERLKQETKFREPPKPEPVKPAARLNAFVLSCEAAKAQGERVPDSSGKGNAGAAKGVSLVDGRAGGKAFRLDGAGHIDVPRSPTLDCSRGAWSIDAVLKSDQPHGVVAAHGGATQGYSLSLVGGRPAFSVTVDNRTTTVSGKQPVVGRWVHLAAVIGADATATLYVDGERAGAAKLPGFIARDPNEGMQIGADTGTPVMEYARPGAFAGLIESVRVFSGERSPADVAKDAAAIR